MVSIKLDTAVMLNSVALIHNIWLTFVYTQCLITYLSSIALAYSGSEWPLDEKENTQDFNPKHKNEVFRHNNVHVYVKRGDIMIQYIRTCGSSCILTRNSLKEIKNISREGVELSSNDHHHLWCVRTYRAMIIIITWLHIAHVVSCGYSGFLNWRPFPCYNVAKGKWSST